MPVILMFVTYTQTAWDILLRSPQNRIEAIRPVVESLGGAEKSNAATST